MRKPSRVLSVLLLLASLALLGVAGFCAWAEGWSGESDAGDVCFIWLLAAAGTAAFALIANVASRRRTPS